jgi:hypothetical protein
MSRIVSYAHRNKHPQKKPQPAPTEWWTASPSRRTSLPPPGNMATYPCLMVIAILLLLLLGVITVGD